MEKKQFILVKSILVLLITAVLASCGKKDSAKLTAYLPQYGSKAATLEETRVSGNKFLDSITFSPKGKLKYAFDLEQPVFYTLAVPKEPKIYLLLKPADNVSITTSDSGVVIMGSDDSQKLNKLYGQLFSIRALLNKTEEEYSRSLSESYRDSLRIKFDMIKKNHYRFSLQFILENLTSLTSLAAIYQEYAPNEFVFSRAKDLQFFKLVTDSLTKLYPKHRHVLALKRNYETMLESYQMGKLMKTTAITEQQIPELLLPDLNGKLISLNGLNSKYILLNFWNQNDQLSQKLFADYNLSFKKYDSRNFNVYNVYLGNALESWQKIIHFEELGDWVNVVDTLFPQSKTYWAYNVQNIPSNYLIDIKEQQILAKDISPALLNQKLEKLLN